MKVEKQLEPYSDDEIEDTAWAYVQRYFEDPRDWSKDYDRSVAKTILTHDFDLPEGEVERVLCALDKWAEQETGGRVVK